MLCLGFRGRKRARPPPPAPRVAEALEAGQEHWPDGEQSITSSAEGILELRPRRLPVAREQVVPTGARGDLEGSRGQRESVHGMSGGKSLQPAKSTFFSVK